MISNLKMELSYSLLFLLSVIPFLYLFVYKLIMPRNDGCFGVENIRLPPGRTGLPLIGETLNYLYNFSQGSLFQFVKERTDKFSSNIIRTSLLGEPVVIIGNAEGNKFLFANEGKFLQLWLPRKMDLIFPKSDNLPSAEQGKRLRGIVHPFVLKTNVLRDRVGDMDDVMKQHLETYWHNKDQVKVREMAQRYTLALACKIFLSIDNLGQIEELRVGMNDIEMGVFSMPINLPWTAMSRGIRASEIVRSKIKAIIKQRKNFSTPLKNDFIAHMLLEVDENGQFLKEADIASHLLGLMEAAYTSLHTTITMLMKNLAEHPSIYESVLKEQTEIARLKEQREQLSWEDIGKMKYSWNVTCEILRLYISTAGFKEAVTDFTYEGYTIPKGWKMHWITLSTHRNPKYFKDPEKFDPTRFDGDGPAPYTFIPFGGGSRMCPGNEYSRVAILTFLHYIVTQFRWEKQIPAEKISGFPVVRPIQGLPIYLYRNKV